MDIYRSEDLRLRRHLAVIASWSDGGFSHQARGIIHALDRRSVTVKLLECRGSYARGALLVLPRFADQTGWSSTFTIRLAPERALRQK